MKEFREGLFGIGAAVLSIVLVLGSFSMAFTESGMVGVIAGLVTETLESGIVPVLTSLPVPITPSPNPAGVVVSTMTETPVATSPCDFPPDWYLVTVTYDRSLEDFAREYWTTADILAEGNCMLTHTLIAGMVVYVPNLPQLTSTPTVVQCGPIPGWVVYIVQPGDTLAGISARTGTTVYQLQVANCIVGSTNIWVGLILYVPYIPSTFTPVPTFISVPTHTPVASLSPTIFLFPTETATSTPEDTATPTGTATDTPTALPTDTPTPLPTETPTQTPTLLPTDTPEATSTNTPAPIAIP
jgi:LysM repeat protein